MAKTPAPSPRSWIASILALALLIGCAQAPNAKPPPSDRLYFPTGIAFARPADSELGYIYVASSNSDRRYDFGTVTAIALDRLGLPPFGLPNASPLVLDIADLKLGANSSVRVQSFAGVFGLDNSSPSGPVRLFLASRSEGDYLHTILADHDRLSCQGAAAGERNCVKSAVSLTEAANTSNVKPRAPQPLGIAVKGRDLWVSHIQPADAPVGSTRDPDSYLVHMPVDDLRSKDWIPIGSAASSSLVAGDRFIFLSGRNTALFQLAIAVRAIDTTNTTLQYNPSLESLFHVNDTRGIGLASNQRTIYVVGRSPETLLVVSVDGTDVPSFRLRRAIPLPLGADQIAVIPRNDGTDLIAITCAADSDFVLYDDRVGRLIADIPGTGSQPYAIAVDSRTLADGRQAARIYLTSFGDGRVIVIDIPDLNTPQQAHVIARLGMLQNCLLQPTDSSCP